MNYYNEFDPKAAAWLRELIRAGLIPPGDVDERSIIEVKADELKKYVQCHFFAGIGGWSRALELAGWASNKPVWTGSCPCQPLSCAGQGKGHADERHLWPAFYGLISECRPATIFGEQVASTLGREWLAGIRADLEGIGYAIGAADLCAASVGAPHIRQRLYWVADATRGQCEQFIWAQGNGLQRFANNRTVGGLDKPDSNGIAPGLSGSHTGHERNAGIADYTSDQASGRERERERDFVGGAVQAPAIGRTLQT